MVSAQFLLSLGYALNNSVVEGGWKEEKKKKKNMQVQAWCGEDEYRSRILPTKTHRQATGVLNLFNSKDTRAGQQECGRLSGWNQEHTWFLLKRALGSVIWVDEVMYLTCPILRYEFGHGLVKAEPLLVPSLTPQNSPKPKSEGLKRAGMAE